jgi:hypothetical protein
MRAMRPYRYDGTISPGFRALLVAVLVASILGALWERFHH